MPSRLITDETAGVSIQTGQDAAAIDRETAVISYRVRPALRRGRNPAVLVLYLCQIGSGIAMEGDSQELRFESRWRFVVRGKARTYQTAGRGPAPLEMTAAVEANSPKRTAIPPT